MTDPGLTAKLDKVRQDQGNPEHIPFLLGVIANYRQRLDAQPATTAEREQARGIAVALENENAHLTDQVKRVRAWATSHDYRWLHELLDGYGTHGGHL